MRSPLKSWAVSLIVAACGAAPAAAQNAFPGADWQQATPQSQGVDPVKLQEATTYLEGFGNADQSIVVIRNGYLISKSSNIDNFHQVWSCTKSFTSTVLGLLIDDGRCTLDTPAKDHLAVLASNYPDVRLRHFATMTSGTRPRSNWEARPAVRARRGGSPGRRGSPRARGSSTGTAP